MKVAVSYFAQLRNFKKNMIPISTAVWDPKWFHDNKGVDYRFIDARGVLNGLRCKDLAPGKNCEGLCKGRNNGCDAEPNSCAFLKTYREQLADIDKGAFRRYVSKTAFFAADAVDVDMDDVIVVFMVYEKYDNPCSEREALLEFLRDCGYDANELEYPIK